MKELSGRRLDPRTILDAGHEFASKPMENLLNLIF